MKAHRKTAHLFLVLVLAAVVCAAGTLTSMSTATAEREDSTESRSFVELVPTPGQVFRTAETGTITALFVTECRVDTPGAELTVRITIDDQVADPGTAVLTTGDRYATHSHLAFKTRIPPEEHKVTVEWKVSTGKAFVRNRSLTVWESR